MIAVNIIPVSETEKYPWSFLMLVFYNLFIFFNK